ncbi:unnamed protein product [Arctia plantaginis]|uniref:Uncharacterized protein n=1 Tax=Arctia plantaginis TaxID=874455 RepID=A0A8S0ZSV7_ARCPL|nr:unnamed protein product [Arctia plantaginis]
MWNEVKVSGGQQSCASAGEIVTMTSQKRAGRKFLPICIELGEQQTTAILLSLGYAMTYIDMVIVHCRGPISVGARPRPLPGSQIESLRSL